MAITQIQAGQKDWLSTLNSNLSQIGDFTEWSTAGITALNGLGNGKNLCWRKATQVVGNKKRVVIEIAGYVTIPSNIASNLTNTLTSSSLPATSTSLSLPISRRQARWVAVQLVTWNSIPVPVKFPSPMVTATRSAALDHTSA